jgi:desulfoferrodoxin (superoxide reductase-like protein)
MKFGKKVLISLMLITTIILSTQAIAHPPQDMVLLYDFEIKILTVTITHNSPGPTLHYINQVNIKVNDELIISESYDSQPSTSQFSYTYTVQAETGDEIEVMAFCNIQGSITRSITVRDPTQDEPPVVEIVNPTEGYFHFSGIRLFPSFGLIGNTLGFGGFRLSPLQFYTEDDIDESNDLIVEVFIDDEVLGTAIYNIEEQLHEIKWTGPALGTFTLSVTCEDSSGNIGSDELEVWYFCFIP